MKRAREQNGGGDFRYDFYVLFFFKRVMRSETCQRAECITTSTVRKICKAGPPKISKHGGFKGGKVRKGNAKGAGCC